MTNEKQIEEIARALCPYEANKNYYKSCELCHKARMTGCDVFNKAQEVYHKILPENAVVLTEEEYTALINEFSALQHKYDDICDRYRLCRDANETIKQHAVMVRKETAREILGNFLQLVREYGNSDFVVCYVRDIDDLAKQYGIEVKND